MGIRTRKTSHVAMSLASLGLTLDDSTGEGGQGGGAFSLCPRCLFLFLATTCRLRSQVTVWSLRMHACLLGRPARLPHLQASENSGQFLPPLCYTRGGGGAVPLVKWGERADITFLVRSGERWEKEA